VRPPKAPRGLSKAGRTEWARLEPLLRARGTLTDANVPLLAAYCGAICMIAEIDRELSKSRLVVKGSTGVPRVHPLVGARNRAAANVLQLARRLGILGSGAAPESSKGGALGDAYTDLGI
jgi:P27 family predicted phage terminase small subunit